MRHRDSTRDPAERVRDGLPLGRRAVLATVTAGLAGCTSGVLDEPSFPSADVIAAPEGELRFEPEDLTVSVGETVRWGFAQAGHNVSCRPGHAETVVLPDGADPFASYGPDDDPDVTDVQRGGTYQHTFDVAGSYTFVCIPHVDDGMVGTIEVE